MSFSWCGFTKIAGESIKANFILIAQDNQFSPVYLGGSIQLFERDLGRQTWTRVPRQRQSHAGESILNGTCSPCVRASVKGNRVDIPEPTPSSHRTSRRRPRERRRRRRGPRQELSSLVDGVSARAWKRSNRREARGPGRAPPLVRRPVRHRRPLKIRRPPIWPPEIRKNN